MGPKPVQKPVGGKPPVAPRKTAPQPKKGAPLKNDSTSKISNKKSEPKVDAAPKEPPKPVMTEEEIQVFSHHHGF